MLCHMRLSRYLVAQTLQALHQPPLDPVLVQDINVGGAEVPIRLLASQQRIHKAQNRVAHGHERALPTPGCDRQVPSSPRTIRL
jgi:hypothetical protein